MRLREVKRAVGALNARQLVKLDAWLHSLLETAERSGGEKSPTKSPGEHKNYQQVMVRCGKKGCRCSRGELHGPYWYAYWAEGGRTRSEYIGKHPPETQKRSPRRSVR